jgi:hypothetical protein
MRHWSLTRMLYWPARAPASFSSRFPGGTRRSLMFSAALMRTSLLYVSLLSSGLSFLVTRMPPTHHLHDLHARGGGFLCAAATFGAERFDDAAPPVWPVSRVTFAAS